MTPSRLLLLFFLLLFLSSSLLVSGQFGITSRGSSSKKKTAFEQAQEEAQLAQKGSKRAAKGSGNTGFPASGPLGKPMPGMPKGLEDLSLEELEGMLAELEKRMSPEERKVMEELLADPKQIEEIIKSMSPGPIDGDAYTKMMDELANLDEDTLKKQIEDIMDSDEMRDLLNDPSALAAQLRGSGLVDDAMLDKMVADPDAYAAEMKEVIEAVKQSLSDPFALKGMVKTMVEAGELMRDPEKLQAALLEVAEEMGKWETDLSMDEKLELVRGEMLRNPSPDLSENPALASVFDTAELRELIGDPNRWREAVKEAESSGGSGKGGRSGSESGRPKPIPVDLKRRGGSMDEM